MSNPLTIALRRRAVSRPGTGLRCIPLVLGCLLVMLAPGSDAAPFDSLDAEQRAEVADRCLPYLYGRDAGDADAVRDCLVRSSMAPRPALSLDERHAVRVHCDGDITCEERESEVLAALDRAAIDRLPVDEHDAVHRHCNSVPDEDGPAAWAGCLQEAVERIEQGPAMNRQGLSFASRRAALSVCTDSEPATYRRCLQEAGMPVDTSPREPAAATPDSSDTTGNGEAGSDGSPIEDGSQAGTAGDSPPGLQARLTSSFESLDNTGRLLLLAAAMLPLLLWLTRRFTHRGDEGLAQEAEPHDYTTGADRDHYDRDERGDLTVDFDVGVDDETLESTSGGSALWGSAPGHGLPPELSNDEPEHRAEVSRLQSEADRMFDELDAVKDTGGPEQRDDSLDQSLGQPLDRTLQRASHQDAEHPFDDLASDAVYEEADEIPTPNEAVRSPSVDHGGRTVLVGRPFDRFDSEEIVLHEQEAGSETLNTGSMTLRPPSLHAAPPAETAYEAGPLDTSARTDLPPDPPSGPPPGPRSEAPPDTPSALPDDTPLEALSEFGHWLNHQPPAARLTHVVEFFVYWMAYGDRRYDEDARRHLLDSETADDGSTLPAEQAIKRWVLLEDIDAFGDALQWMMLCGSSEQRRQTVRLLIALLVTDAVPTPVQNTLLRFLADAFGLQGSGLQALWQEGFGAALPSLPRVDRSDWWDSQNERALAERDARRVASYPASARHAARLGLPLRGPYEAARIRAASRVAIQRTEPERFDALGERARALAARQLERIEQARDALLEEALP